MFELKQMQIILYFLCPQYHGIMGIRLSAGTIVPRKSRKENKHLFSRSGQMSTPPAVVQSEPRQNKNKQRKKLNRLKKKQTVSTRFFFCLCMFLH